MTVARHFHLDLQVFNLLLSERVIFGPVPCNSRSELAIFALIAHDFGVDLMTCGKSSSFSYGPYYFLVGSLLFS